MKKTLITHINQIATPLGSTLRKGKEMNHIQITADGAVYMEDGCIQMMDTTQKVLSSLEDIAGIEIIDGTGKCAVPGFVDSHTHLVFAGYRPEEFVARLQGAQYLDIMKMGGGIQNTVNSTKKASDEELEALGLERLGRMLEQGITTVEGKSGYGLDLECELKQLRVMRDLAKKQPVDIVRTYLGAHAVPPEYKGRTDVYVDFMVREVISEVARLGLAQFCDVFCEKEVFSVEQSRKLLLAAQKHGLRSKIHADEIIPLGGGELAGELGAVSADHLLGVSDQGISALAENDVVATLLPCTAFCLDKPYAPARKIIDRGCAVALASDLNPGSCFTNSVGLMFALAVIHMKMTIEEALTAMTLNGAAALDKADAIGSIEAGKKADLLLLKYPTYHFLVYHTGMNIVDTVIKNGVVVYQN